MEAEQFMIQGHKALKKSFFKKPDLLSAADNFNQASEAFEKKGDYASARESWKYTADCLEKLGESVAAGNCYVSAAKLSEHKEALPLYEKAIMLLLEGGSSMKAANCYLEIAAFCDDDEILPNLKKARKLCHGAIIVHSATEILQTKLEEGKIEQGIQLLDFLEEIFEEINQVFNSEKAVISKIVLTLSQQNYTLARQMQEKYFKKIFSEEFIKLLEDLNDAVDRQDEMKWLNTCRHSQGIGFLFLEVAKIARGMPMPKIDKKLDDIDIL